VNKVEDLVFLGAGSSCRGNISDEWTGGKTCDNPRIICLPQENTPSLDIMGEPYKDISHRYTVPECLKECSYDQKCLGIEFVADTNSTMGDCILIDSIPVGIENEIVDFEYTGDSDNLGGNALCWGKQDYCNPYFEADDLTDEMLNCYCPNNRKDFYTKKVKRIVNNTRFCDNDTTVDERIRKAQANRMFHLCENWCLFDTFYPEQEFWYWDPWKTCWRETWAVNQHRGYCDRVIRKPNSIEMKFLSHRSEHFCGATKPPTSSPVADVNTTRVLAEKLESCDEACFRNGLECAAEQTATVFKTELDLIDAFAEAGVECLSDNIVMNRTSFDGWALPGMRTSNNVAICGNRQQPLSHLRDIPSDCNRVIGGVWQRLCACF